MKKFKQLLIQLFCTYIGWLFISIILIIVFGLLSTHSTFITGWIIFDYLMILPGAYIAILTIVMMAYAWIINPWKNRKK